MSGTAAKAAPAGTDPLYQLESTNLHARREYRVKGDLRVLATEILAKFPRALRDLAGELDSAGPSEIIAEYNLASLALVQYGCPEKGLALCEKAIRICLQLGRESGTPRWMSELFQPYINIGRIAAAQGDADRALAIFRRVFRFVTVHEDFELYGCRLNSAVLAPPPHQIARAAPLFEVYLQDSLKALAWAGRYTAMLVFLDETEGLAGFDTPHFFRIITESRARALMELGRYAEAARAMDKLVNLAGTDSLPQPAICVLLAEIYRQAYDLNAAGRVMRAVEEHYPPLCLADVPLTERRKFWYLVGLQYYRLGDLDKSAAAIEQALSMNQELGDEPGVLKCGILLLRCASHRAQDTTARFATLRETARSTLYRQEQALAYYELAQCAARDSKALEAANLLEICTGILHPVGTVDARFLYRQAVQAKAPRRVAGDTRSTTSTCTEMDEMFSLLSHAGVSEPLLPHASSASSR